MPDESLRKAAVRARSKAYRARKHLARFGPDAGDMRGGAMTPERLAEEPRDFVEFIQHRRESKVLWDAEAAVDVLIAHIRDLEAQVREGVRLATKLIEETNKQSVRFPGSWSTAFTDLNDWSDDADELLATATPPSPEVGE